MPQYDEDLLTFFKEQKADVTDAAFDVEHGGIRLLAFGKVILDGFEESGFIDSGRLAYFMKPLPRGTPEVHAYAADADDDLLTLYLFIEKEGDEPTSIQKADVEGAYRRMQLFVKLASSGQLDAIVEPSQPVNELVKLLKEKDNPNLRILFSVVTNGLMSDRASGSVDDESKDTWDILRLYRAFGVGVSRDPINVDFQGNYGGSLPCLVTPPAADGLQVYLTRIRGDVLARLYERYRSRLLERNVRSFLQFAGKVNQGIKDTIESQPDRFLPYNNGISVTAAMVVTKPATDGLAYIDVVDDFQIVNGGQTTASLASCARRGDVSAIFVQMKLTVVPKNKLDEVVPLISQYANTQNTIQAADFKANHPYHIAVEKQSRDSWTHPNANSSRGTRWFYERSRGQYLNEKTRFADAGRRRFEQENPRAQKFSKTDLAKYLMSWDQYPQKVSLGAQKNFMQFMNLIDRENRPLPDAPEFKRIVALAMLFKRAEKLYGELGFAGYRAQVSSYTLAMLSYRFKKHLEWRIFAETNMVPESFVEMMRSLMITANNIITNPPPRWSNMSEWCKKEECWMAILQANTEEIEGLPVQEPPSTVPLPDCDKQLLEAVTLVPAAVWFEIAAWAKQNDNLPGWQRSMVFNIGKTVARNLAPSVKLAKYAPKIVDDAWEAGFRHEQLDATALQRLRNLKNEA